MTQKPTMIYCCLKGGFVEAELNVCLFWFVVHVFQENVPVMASNGVSNQVVESSRGCSGEVSVDGQERIPISSQRRSKCSRCKSIGHTARSKDCPGRKLTVELNSPSVLGPTLHETSHVSDDIEMSDRGHSGPSSRVYHCSRCQTVGHSARSRLCPLSTVSGRSTGLATGREESPSAHVNLRYYIVYYIGCILDLVVL